MWFWWLCTKTDLCTWRFARVQWHFQRCNGNGGRSFHLVMDFLVGPLHWKAARMTAYDTVWHKISVISRWAQSTWTATRATTNKNTIVIGHAHTESTYFSLRYFPFLSFIFGWNYFRSAHKTREHADKFIVDKMLILNNKYFIWSSTLRLLLPLLVCWICSWLLLLRGDSLPCYPWWEKKRHDMHVDQFIRITCSCTTTTTTSNDYSSSNNPKTYNKYIKQKTPEKHTHTHTR